MVITEKPLTYVGISGIVFPTILVMMFPEGTAIYSIANILLTLFSGFLFILTIFSACGQKKVIKLEESYDIPLFESFASNFGDECAIVWKKTNELVEIPGNDGLLTYTDAHRVLNEYLKENPDQIWGVQIVPRVEIVTHLYPIEETEPKSFVDEVEEISIDEAHEDQAITDEIEDISPIKEIDLSTVEDTEDTLPIEDIQAEVYEEVDSEIVPVEEIEEIDIKDDTEALSVEEETENIMDTEGIEEISSLEDINYLTTGKEQEKAPPENDTETKSKVELLSNIPDPYILTSTEEISEIKESEERTPEKDPETKAKVEFLSNIPDPYILTSTEEISEIKELEEKKIPRQNQR
ncbi:MAG: hypothetical protein ACXADW_05750 [Candidatus Hodarchaeales archaeon]|jgi:hypothetical protein